MCDILNLNHFKHLKRLRISFCNLYEFPESWLFGLEKLEHLELDDNNLRYLRFPPNLRIISLTNNKFNDVNLLDVLDEDIFSNLEYLHLNYNAILISRSN